MQEIGGYQACAPEGRVARSYGSRHHTEYRQHGTGRPHPILANGIDHNGGIGFSRRRHQFGQRLITACKLNGRSRPYQSYHTLGYHSTVEHAPPQFLVLHATRHHRALGGMKTADSPAGYRNEKHGKYGKVLIGMMALESRRNLGHPTVVGENADQHTDSHKQQGHTEKGVDTSDKGIDGQQSSQHVIHENHNAPKQSGTPCAPVPGHGSQQPGGRGDKYRADQDHQNQGKDSHHQADARPQFVAHHFGQTGSVLPQGNHAGQVVVHRPAEYASEHNPQISRRPVKDTQNRTEYRSRPGNVQKLDEIDFPRRHRCIIHTVGHRITRCLSGGIHPEYSFDKGTVDDIAQHQ